MTSAGAVSSTGVPDVNAKAPTTRSLALKGSAWSMVGYGSAQVLALVSSVVLARWLSPEYFGYMGMVAVFSRGLQMFSDFGIGPSIIQNPRGEERAFRDTAWTIQVTRGLVLWLVMCAIAWPISKAYGAQYLWLLPVVGLTAVIAGFNATALFTVNRRMAYGRLAIIDFASQIVSIGIMIGWAYFRRDVWPLVGGTLAGSAVRMILSHVLLGGWQDRPRIDRTALHELIKFGGWLTVSTAVTFVSGQADRLILGLVVSAAMLGVYNVALRLARLPVDIATTLAEGVLFPALSRAALANEASLEPSFRRARWAILPVALLTTLGVALGAPVFFRLLYKPEWAAAGWIAPALAGVFWFELLQLSADRVLLTTGRTRALATTNVVKAIVTAAGCLVGNALGGMPGFLIGMGVGSLSAHAVVQVTLQRMRIPILDQDARYTVALVTLVAASMGASYALGTVLPAWAALVAELLPPAIVGIGVGFWAWRRVRRAFIH